LRRNSSVTKKALLRAPRNAAWGALNRPTAARSFSTKSADLPAEIQIALLRVLQEREVERVGSSRPIPVDVRVVAATHHDLNALVAEGKFRQDLLYRLNVVPIQMPPLRERVSDIPCLSSTSWIGSGKGLERSSEPSTKITRAL